MAKNAVARRIANAGPSQLSGAGFGSARPVSPPTIRPLARRCGLSRRSELVRGTTVTVPLCNFGGEDGRASERRLEGSVKGEAAINSDLVPRLRRLLFGQG